MKKAMCIVAAVIFLFSLAGCAETAGPAPSESSAALLVSKETVQESTAAQESAAAFSSDSKTAIPATETEKANEPEQEAPAGTSGVSTEAPAETEKQQETPATQPRAAETPQPAFCIDDWIAYAQSYAGSVGLNLDSTVTGCWDNPIVAGAHCDYLERDIQSRLNRYAKDDSILDVWIWAESRSDGSYDLYIGYA